MNPLPSVIRAQYRERYRMHLTFSDNSEKTVDFQQWLSGPIFEPLKDLAYFRRFFLDGGTVAWPNGADIAPETLYEASSFQPKQRPNNKRILAARSRKRTESRTPPRRRKIRG